MYIDNVDISNNDTNDFVFGNCQPGKESCRDCFLTLVKSIFGNGDNVINLSKEFTSLIHDEPNTVVVKYHFINETMNSRVVWFWARSEA